MTLKFQTNLQTAEAIPTPIFESPVRSILQLFNHLFESEDYLLRQTLEREPSVYPAVGFDSLNALQASLREHAGTLLTLAGLGPEGGWAARFELPGHGGLAYPGYQIFLHYLTHETHHRGQIALLLRLNGITPPPLDYL